MTIVVCVLYTGSECDTNCMIMAAKYKFKFKFYDTWMLNWIQHGEHNSFAQSWLTCNVE